MGLALNPPALALSLVLAASLAAQEPAFDRLRSESLRLRQSSLPETGVGDQISAVRHRSSAFHVTVRDWVESLLPQSPAALATALPVLNARIAADLKRAGLLQPDNSGSRKFQPGFLTSVALSSPPEDPGKVLVFAGVDVPCGHDDALYVYDYGSGTPQRVLESHGASDHDDSLAGVHFSARDLQRNQLALTLRFGAQCGSSWNILSYDLTRLSAGAPPQPVLRGEHSVWFGGGEPFQVRLGPDDLLLELRDRSIDSGLHSRAHVLHFKVSGTAATRVDPIALQPQDFVDEWLSRPWTEMQSRSAPGTQDQLAKWHKSLAAEFVSGDFKFVQPCRSSRGHFQIGIDLGQSNGKESSVPVPVYFLVRQSAANRFQMEGISYHRQGGCPGQAPPKQASPTLFPASAGKL